MAEPQGDQRDKVDTRSQRKAVARRIHHTWHAATADTQHIEPKQVRRILASCARKNKHQELGHHRHLGLHAPRKEVVPLSEAMGARRVGAQ